MVLINESTINNYSVTMATQQANDVTSALKIPHMCVYAFIVIVGIAGNTLVCRTILLQPKKRTNDYFILNLAITDLGTCALSVPFDMAEQLTKTFPFGEVMCSILYPLQTVLVAVSAFTLLAMSIERYKAIVTPLRPKLRGKLAKAMLIGGWAVSMAVLVPYIKILEYKDEQCTERWPVESHAKIYTFCLFVILYAVPMVVITACYTCVLHKIYKDKAKLARLSSAHASSKAARRRAKQNMRMVKMFVTAVVAFALCLLPNHVAWLWYDFGNGGTKPYFGIILIFSGILIYTNSIINPFIFGKLNFRSLFAIHSGRQWFSLRSSLEAGSGGNISGSTRQLSFSGKWIIRGHSLRRQLSEVNQIEDEM